VIEGLEKSFSEKRKALAAAKTITPPPPSQNRNNFPKMTGRFEPLYLYNNGERVVQKR